MVKKEDPLFEPQTEKIYCKNGSRKRPLSVFNFLNIPKKHFYQTFAQNFPWLNTKQTQLSLLSNQSNQYV